MTEISTDRLRISANLNGFSVIGLLVEWLNDPEVVKYSEQRHKTHTLRTQYEYIDSFLFPSIYRIITLRNSNKIIGSISARVDHHNDIADIGIMVGDKQEWGKGYGHEAWQVMMRYLFATKIRKITGGAMSCNRSMIHIFLKNEMRMEGLLKGHHLLKDQPVDVELWSKFKSGQTVTGIS